MLDERGDSQQPFDRELVRHHDAARELLTALVRKLQPAWAAFIRPEQVEDEVAELLLAVLKSKATYDPSRAFLPWVAGLAMRRLADRQRQFYRERARPQVRTQAGFQADETFDALAAAVAARDHPDPCDWRVPLLRAELDRLPDNERAAIRRVYFDGARYAEVARELGVTTPAARGVVCRGLKRLAQRLGAALGRHGPGPHAR